MLVAEQVGVRNFSDIQYYQHMLARFLSVYCTAVGFPAAKAGMLWPIFRHAVKAVFMQFRTRCSARGVLRHALDEVYRIT